jgi:hypothetical protein
MRGVWPLNWTEIGFSFPQLVGTAAPGFFFRLGLFKSQRDIGELQHSLAVRRAARTIFPRAISGRALQAIPWRDPKLVFNGHLIQMALSFLSHQRIPIRNIHKSPALAACGQSINP